MSLVHQLAREHFYDYLEYAVHTIERGRILLKNATVITNGMPSGTITDGDCSEATGADGAPPAAASDDDDGGESDGEPARPRPRKTSRRVAAPLPAHALRTATASAGTTPPPLPHSGHLLWKIDTVLGHYPVSRSAWYQGVKDGKYPQSVKLGARSVAWRSAEVLALIESLQSA